MRTASNRQSLVGRDRRARRWRIESGLPGGPSLPVLLGVTSLALTLLASRSTMGQGPLTPPGPPAPSFKTLEQVEPRTPITNLPYAISQPGSYYFVTNLTGGTGITISASGVTLDLMGFALVGGTGGGITVSGIRTNICIRSGTVSGWDSNGVDAGNARNSRLEQLSVSSNNGDGIAAGAGCTIVGCTVQSNADGIRTDDACTIRGCTVLDNVNDGIVLTNPGSTVADSTVRGNGGYGISGADRCAIHGCVATGNSDTGISVQDNSSVVHCAAGGNGGGGISVGAGCVIKDCSATSNGSAGIAAGTAATIIACAARANTNGIVAVTGGAVIKDCTVSSNNERGIEASQAVVSGCTAWRNTLDGINVVDGSLLLGNTCTENGFQAGSGAGIRSAGNSNRIEGNNVTNNDRGIDMIGGGNLIIKNSAKFNPPTGSLGSSNYVIAAGNSLGEILVVSNSVSTVIISNANPWANFSY